MIFSSITDMLIGMILGMFASPLLMKLVRSLLVVYVVFIPNGIKAFGMDATKSVPLLMPVLKLSYKK
jgi:predicted Na+-dependent transporter